MHYSVINICTDTNMQLIIFAAIVGVCAAGALPQSYLPPQRSAAYSQESNRPQASRERNAAILRSESDVNEQGFHYAFETENGIKAEESGQEAGGIQAHGGYSYTGDDGQVYSITYTADANGYQPQGAHLPTPPPIPEAIARALEVISRSAASGASNGYNSGAPGVTVARTQPSRQYLGPQSGSRSQAGYHY